MPPVPPKTKTTPEQRFAQYFRVFIDKAAKPGERAEVERRMDVWLKRHGKVYSDIPAILAQAAADDLAANPPPPPSDPRDDAPHPYDNPEYTPAGLVEGIVAKYVTMNEHVRVIYVLWICFTHVFLKFMRAPRIALVSEGPDMGKTTALDVARSLVFRPNEEALGTGASIRDFLREGPGTVLLDELFDDIDPDARRALRKIWNYGHKRGEKISLMVKGVRTLVSIYAPMMATGIDVGRFLAPQQRSRAFELEMQPYTAETKPERDYDNSDLTDLNAVYSYLHAWSSRAELNLKPSMPTEMLRRFGDNARGLISIADSCGPEWGRRAREAMTWLHEKQKAERPFVLILRHILVVIDQLELDPVPTLAVNRELRRLPLPDAQWDRYRGPEGDDAPHPLTIGEQAKLLAKSDVASRLLGPRGKRFHAYRREWIVEALRQYDEPAALHLRLIAPESD